MAEPNVTLSRRERQIMDVIYAAGKATGAEVLAGLADPPSYSAVRALLRILEEKGHLRHKEVKGKYVYSPTRPRGAAGRGALRRVLATFFDSSPGKAMAALLEASDTQLSGEELAEISALIEQARQRGTKP
jgi:predicted transcriptional regulator